MHTRRASAERGQTLVWVAILLVAVVGALGLSVDVGRSVLTQFRAQNAVDAAALAGVTDLPVDLGGATALAQTYGAANGLSGPVITVSSDEQEITVSAQRTVPTLFMRVLGVQTADVAVIAHARTSAPTCAGGSCVPSCLGGCPGPGGGPTAGCAAVYVGGEMACVSAAVGQFGLAPWDVGIDEIQPLVGASGCVAEGDCPAVTFKVSTTANTGGNFGALAIGGTGASTYKANIVNGAASALHIGDAVSTETGDIVGPTLQGTNARLGDGAPYVLLPVTTDITGSGNTTLRVLGFAAFEVLGVTTDGAGGAAVFGKFILADVPGLSGRGTTDSSQTFGVYGGGTLSGT